MSEEKKKLESICHGCCAAGFCQIQDNKNDSQYDCQINSKWAEAQRNLKAIKKILEEISWNRGRCRIDPLKHCTNTVEDMKKLANKGLKLLGAKKERK